jgi:hypothetical protein
MNSKKQDSQKSDPRKIAAQRRAAHAKKQKSKAKAQAPAKTVSVGGILKKILFVFLALILLLIIAYVGIGFYFRSHFFPGTRFDSVDIGNKTLEQAKELIQKSVDEYTLLVTDADGNTYNLKGSDFSLSMPDDGSLEDTLTKQNSFLWISGIFSNQEIEQDFTGSYDSDKLQTAIKNLSCFSPSNTVEPTNASLTYSEEEKKFVVTPEQRGNALNESAAIAKITSAVDQLALDVSLTDDEYQQASITSGDATLNAAADTANTYLGTTITYDIYGTKSTDEDDVIDADRISGWISISDDYEVSINEKAVYSFVQSLASKYNTYAHSRSFTTSLGDTITVSGGDYGWIIDRDDETAQIIADLQSSETNIERDPVYQQTAMAAGPNDLGNTYLEIDYDNQHFYYYQNGELKLDSDIVSGNVNVGNGSPDGIFSLKYKQKDATLVGEDYESKVRYFMVFAYNVGFHDADWRSSFGGSIYLSSGSHGCINLPVSVAESLYNLLSSDKIPVIAYYRNPIKLTSENAKQSNAMSYVSPDAETDSSSN